MELKTTRCWEAGDQVPGEPESVDLESVTGTIHFIGIGGIGMSALARLLLARGQKVSGSDKEGNKSIDELRDMGATIFIGHDAKNIDGAGLIAVSTAITDANQELAAARTRGLKVLHRSDILRGLTKTKKVVAVSGTHGKTTTTGMVAQVFMDNGTEPEVVVGGIFSRIGSNSYAGKGEYFIAEADESDRTHAKMNSFIAVVTNIEPDHLENYPGGMQEICENMISFANRATQAVVLCIDDAGCRSIMDRLKTRVVTYGTKEKYPNADYSYESTRGGLRVFSKGKALGDITLAVPGEHNKMNALAAIAVAMESGLPFAKSAEALSSFGGVARRFQLIGIKSGITVVDDYGHHPTEVRATLQAARQYISKPENNVQRVVAIFQPHQPGRLRDLWDDFTTAFDEADLVLLADVYIARGGQIEGINSERFAAACTNKNMKHLAGATAQLAAQARPHLRQGDLVLTIGAGDITRVGPELLKLL